MGERGSGDSVDDLSVPGRVGDAPALRLDRVLRVLLPDMGGRSAARSAGVMGDSGKLCVEDTEGERECGVPSSPSSSCRS